MRAITIWCNKKLYPFEGGADFIFVIFSEVKEANAERQYDKLVFDEKRTEEQAALSHASTTAPRPVQGTSGLGTGGDMLNNVNGQHVDGDKQITFQQRIDNLFSDSDDESHLNEVEHFFTSSGLVRSKRSFNGTPKLALRPNKIISGSMKAQTAWRAITVDSDDSDEGLPELPSPGTKKRKMPELKDKTLADKLCDLHSQIHDLNSTITKWQETTSDNIEDKSHPFTGRTTAMATLTGLTGTFEATATFSGQTKLTATFTNVGGTEATATFTGTAQPMAAPYSTQLSAKVALQQATLQDPVKQMVWRSSKGGSAASATVTHMTGAQPAQRHGGAIRKQPTSQFEDLVHRPWIDGSDARPHKLQATPGIPCTLSRPAATIPVVPWQPPQIPASLNLNLPSVNPLPIVSLADHTGTTMPRTPPLRHKQLKPFSQTSLPFNPRPAAAAQPLHYMQIKTNLESPSGQVHERQPTGVSVRVQPPAGRIEPPAVANIVEPPAVANWVELTAVANRVEPPAVVRRVEPPAVAMRMELPTVANRIEPPAVVRRVEPPAVSMRMELPTVANRVEPPAVAMRMELPAVANRWEPPAVANRVVPPAVANRVEPPAVANRVGPPAVTMRVEPPAVRELADMRVEPPAVANRVEPPAVAMRVEPPAVRELPDVRVEPPAAQVEPLAAQVELPVPPRQPSLDDLVTQVVCSTCCLLFP